MAAVLRRAAIYVEYKLLNRVMHVECKLLRHVRVIHVEGRRRLVEAL
jgi:hypothetical protein